MFVVALQVGNRRMNGVTLTGALIHTRVDQLSEDVLCGTAFINKQIVLNRETGRRRLRLWLIHGCLVLRDERWWRSCARLDPYYKFLPQDCQRRFQARKF